MAYKTEKTLLIYGFNSEEENTLKKIISENKLPSYKVVTKAMMNVKIGIILSMPSKSNDSSNTSNKESEESSAEKIVLFNKCSEEEVKNAMKAIKESFSVKPIFAVVTPTSIQWKFKYLLEHLLQEKVWYENRMKGEKQQ